MTAARKTQLDDIEKFFSHDVYLPTRTLYMGSCGQDWDGGDAGVNFMMAERVVKGLHVLEACAPKPPADNVITLVMNNPGGDVYHGMAIYDAIRACISHVTIKVYGHAMSMGAVILQAADERVLAPNAKVMIHYGYQGHASNHPRIVQRWCEEYKRVDAKMEEILLARIREKHPTFPPERVRELLMFDTILTAQEAVDLGLADAIA